MSRKFVFLIVFMILVIDTAACSSLTSEQITPTLTEGMSFPANTALAPTQDLEAGELSYNDPFDYCLTIETIDTPGERYVGPEMPDSIVLGMIEQKIVSNDTPQEFQTRAVWRCMNTSVWVCHYGANLPCLEKADTTQEPNLDMETYCQANPTSDFIPASVTGRATVYEWRCKDGKPKVVQQYFTVDPQGYLAEFWYELASPE